MTCLTALRPTLCHSRFTVADDRNRIGERTVRLAKITNPCERKIDMTTNEMTNEELPAVRKLDISELDAISGGIIGGDKSKVPEQRQRNSAVRAFLVGFYENCGCTT